MGLQSQEDDEHDELHPVKEATLPIDQVEIELGDLLNGLRGGKQVSRTLGGQELAIVGAERQRTIAMPDELEESVGTATIASGLNATTRREAPVTILCGPQCPTMRRPIVFQLECLILPHLVLIGGHVDALLDTHIAQVEASYERCLRQRILQREELIPGHSRGAGLEHRLGANRGQVLTLTIAQCQVPAMILRAEQTILVADHLQFAIGIQVSAEEGGRIS